MTAYSDPYQQLKFLRLLYQETKRIQDHLRKIDGKSNVIEIEVDFVTKEFIIDSKRQLEGRIERLKQQINHQENNEG